MASKIIVDQLESSGSNITIPTGTGLVVTDGIAATNLSGTIADARLPTVPVTKGGTGLTSLGSAGQAVKVNSAGNALEFGAVASGNVSQVRTTGDQSFNDTSNYTVITDLSLSVTPSSTSTKLLIILNTYANLNGSQGWGLRVKKDGSVIATQRTTHAVYQGSGGDHEQNHFTVIHSPNTTSSITFTVEAINNNNNTVLFNNGDFSTMTIVEI